MPPLMRSSSPGRSHSDQDDPTEEDNEEVQLVGSRTPNRPPSLPRPDLSDHKAEELQHLPKNRLSNKHGSGAAIPIPIPGRYRLGGSVLDSGVRPVNTLNKPQHQRSLKQVKRKLTQSEALANQPYRPKRVKEEEQSEEDTIVVKGLSRITESSPATIKASSSKKSNLISQARDNTSKAMQSSSRAASEESVSDKTDSFLALVNSIPNLTRIRPRIREGPATWASESNDPQHTRWKNTKGPRPRVRPNKNVFQLICFQRGPNFVDSKCSHEKCRGLVIEKSPGDVYKLMHGPQELEDMTFQLDQIRKIYLGDKKRCAIDLKEERGFESDCRMMFTFKNQEGHESFIHDMQTESQVLKDKPPSWWENRIKTYTIWQEAGKKKAAQRLIEEPLPHPKPQAYPQSRRQSIEERADDQVEVVILSDPKRPAQPVKRLTRRTIALSTSGVLGEIGESSGVHKSESVIKRRRGSPADDVPRETRFAKVRKLELPTPKWPTPLVYPFEGPKRQVVEYQDLARLDTEEFLNDNLINFYLRYIEEELKKRDPELAKETYFLNTFFYEILSRKGGKGKRNFDSVLKWTAKVDLFNMNYIIIPINESSHWYLAIICNLQNLERKMLNNVPVSPNSIKTIDLESSSTTLADDGDGREEIEDESAHFSDSAETAAQKLQADAQADTKDCEPRDAGTVEGTLEQMSLDEDEWPKEDMGEPSESNTRADAMDDSVEFEVLSSKTSKKKVKAKQSSRRSVPPDTPAIIILDSMGFGTSSRPTTIKNLREYLAAEALNKRSLEITKDDVDATYAKAPNQNNYYDCGPYLLHYVERFFEQPKEFVAAFLAREDVKLDKELWRKDEIKGMRGKIFDVIMDLREQYEKFELGKGAERAKAKANGLKKDVSEGEGSNTSKVSVKDADSPAKGGDGGGMAVEARNDGDHVMGEGGVIVSPKSAMSTSRSPSSKHQQHPGEDCAMPEQPLDPQNKP